MAILHVSGAASLMSCMIVQFESIANFSAVIDRLGEFSEVLESSAIARPASSDAQQSDAAPAGQQSLISLVDQPGNLSLLQTETSV